MCVLWVALSVNRKLTRSKEWLNLQNFSLKRAVTLY